DRNVTRVKTCALPISVLLVGLIFAGNYFYGEGIKRGTEVELHRESEEITINASVVDQEIFEEAKEWFNNQDREILEMIAYDDLKLSAQYIENENQHYKTVVLAHGFRNTSDDMGKLAKFYYDQGFNVLLPDARGHGESEGDYIGYGWHDRLDYVDWIDVLIDEYGAEEIILHGN